MNMLWKLNRVGHTKYFIKMLFTLCKRVYIHRCDLWLEKYFIISLLYLVCYWDIIGICDWCFILCVSLDDIPIVSSLYGEW